MPKFRIYTKQNRSGFTLIELMVVISIIAVLSVIGFALFTNAQKSARDATRRQEIDAIMKALEVNYASRYGPILDDWFAGGKVPRDPLSSGCNPDQIQNACGSDHTKSCAYCLRRPEDTEINCSGSWCIEAGRFPSGVTSLRICANLETNAGPGGTYYYCRRTQQ